MQPQSPWFIFEAIASSLLLIAALVFFLLRFARGKVWLGVALGIAFADQLTKFIVLHATRGGQKIDLPGPGSVVYFENHLLGFDAPSHDLFVSNIGRCVSAACSCDTPCSA